MEVALVAVLITAAVGLIGFLVNLEVTKRAARATREQSATSEWQKEERSGLDRLRQYEVEVERLRSACWPLYHAVRHLITGGTTEERIKQIDTRWGGLSATFEQYWIKWAETRPDVSDSAQEFARTLRHEVMFSFDYLREAIAMLQIASVKQMKSHEIRDLHETIQAAIKQILFLLDQQLHHVHVLRETASLALLDATQMRDPLLNYRGKGNLALPPSSIEH